MDILISSVSPQDNLSKNRNFSLNNNSNNSPEEYDYDYDTSLTTFNYAELVPTVLVYGMTFLIGTLGNGLVIFCIIRFRKMRNITNVFLISLASADLLLIFICVPIKFAYYLSFTWRFGEGACRAIHYMQNVSVLSSVMTLTSMSLERYYAILHPMKAKYMCTIGQARKVTIAIWILSFLLAIPTIFAMIHVEVGIKYKAFWCRQKIENHSFEQAYDLFMLVLIFILPVLIMSFAYVSICKELWIVTSQRSSMTGGGGDTIEPSNENYMMVNNQRTSSRSKGTSRSDEHDKTRKQVIKMLVMIIVLFGICWGPYLFSEVLTAYGYLEDLNYGYLRPLRMTFYLLAYFNSCVNPIVYGFMSKNFRKSFKYALYACVKGRAYVRQHRLGFQTSFTHTRTTSISYNYDQSTCVSKSDGNEIMLNKMS